MALQQISIRIDDELKQRTDETMKLLGTNPTQAITLLYQYIAENGKLPFTVSSRLLSSEDYTQKLITTARSIYHFWDTIAGSMAKVRTQSGMAYSMTLAAQVSSLHSDLMNDSGTLLSGEVELLMDVIESILSTPPSFYSGAPGGHELQDKLNIADQNIQALEKHHGMPVQQRQDINGGSN